MSKDFFFDRYRDMGQKPSDVKIGKSVRFSVPDHAALLKRLSDKGIILKKIPFLDNGYWVGKSKVSVGATVEYLLGMYYVQEAASQLPVQALFSEKSKADEVILDACAAPGGKTTQIASYHPGPIVAVEKMGKRIYSLKNNCERMGASQVAIYKKDARFSHEFGVKFDRILIDAPCSGNFVIDEQWFGKRSVPMFLENQRKQKEIFKSAIRCLKPGGTLVYSTCSLEPEEDEMVIDWALKKYPDLKLVPIDLEIGEAGLTSFEGKSFDPSLAHCKRLWPWTSRTQGFFIAKFKRKEGEH